MHLYAVVYFHDPLLKLLPRPRPDKWDLDEEAKLRHGLVQFFWADDADHAMEQAVDAGRHDTALPAFCARVPDEYVLVPSATREVRRRLKAACAHELDYAYGPGLIGPLICRLFGHRWEVCEEHGVRWCDRCQTEEEL